MKISHIFFLILSIYSLQISVFAQKSEIKENSKILKADTINYTTDKINYDIKNKRVYFLENNQIFYKNYVLVADSITMDMKTSLTSASKNLYLVDQNSRDTIYLDSLAFNGKTKKGLFWNINGQQEGGIYSGEVIKREDNDNYLGHNFFYTTDLDSSPAHYFYAEKLKLKTDTKVAFAKPIVMTIADVPVLPLPLFVKPYNKDRRSGFLMPTYGGSESNGREIRNIGYYLVLAENMDIEGVVDTYEKKGVGLQTRFRWKTKFYIPNADFYYKRYLNLNSTNTVTGYNDNFRINFKSYFDSEKKYTLSANGSMASSKDVLEDFEDNQDDRLKAQDQSINVNFRAKPSDNFNLSVYVKKDADLLRKTSNYTSPDITISSLPNIRYSTILPFIYGEKKWFYKSKKVNLTKSMLDKVYLSIGSPTFKRSEHVDDSISYYDEIKYGYSIPLSLRTASIDAGPFKITPSLNFSHIGMGTYLDSTLLDSIVTIHKTDSGLVQEVTYYKPLDDGSIDSSFYGEQDIDSLVYVNSWQASLRMSTNIYGLSKLNFRKLKAVRHRFSPSVSLNYAKGMDKEEQYHYKKKMVGSIYSTKKKSLNFGMSNGWDFKWKKSDSSEVKKYSLINVGSSIGYNFEAEDKKLSILTNSVSFPMFSLVSGHFNVDFYNDDTVLTPTQPILSSYGYNFNLPINISGIIFNGDLEDWNDLTKMKRNRIQMSSSFHFSYSANKVREGVYRTSKNFNTNLNAGVDLTKSMHLNYNTRVDLVSSEFLSHEFYLTKKIRRWQLDIRWIPKGTRKMWSMNVRLLDLGDIKYDKKEYY